MFYNVLISDGQSCLNIPSDDVDFPSNHAVTVLGPDLTISSLTMTGYSQKTVSSLISDAQTFNSGTCTHKQVKIS